MKKMTSPLPGSGEPMGHYVSDEPFDVMSIEKISPEQEKIYLAPQWKLMWWKFKQHRIAVWCGVFLAILYSTIFVSEFLAPYNMQSRNVDYIYAPPQQIRLFHEGSFIGPFVYRYKYNLNMETLKREYTEDLTQPDKIRFFCKGDTYWWWGLVKMETHLICPAEGGHLFLLGTDRLGRDMLSRIINGARISLTIGLLGVMVSFHPRHRDWGHGRLLWRLGGHDRAAHDRGAAVAAVDPVVAGAGGHHAGNVEPAGGLFRDYRHPGAA
jgi:peptide/nickel transport system permease protein